MFDLNVYYVSFFLRLIENLTTNFLGIMFFAHSIRCEMCAMSFFEKNVEKFVV